MCLLWNRKSSLSYKSTQTFVYLAEKHQMSDFGSPSKDFPFSLMIITSIKMFTATIKCGQKQRTNPQLLYCLNEDRRQKGTPHPHPTGHCRYSPTFFLYSSYFSLTQQQFLITTNTIEYSHCFSSLFIFLAIFITLFKPSKKQQ